MSVFAALKERLDAPRFCRDCGKAIRVDNFPEFDERTGEAKDQWLWRCPQTHVTVSSRGYRAQSSGYFVHSWGTGRPRWHVALPSEAVPEEPGS